MGEVGRHMAHWYKEKAALPLGRHFPMPGPVRPWRTLVGAPSGSSLHGASSWQSAHVLPHSCHFPWCTKGQSTFPRWVAHALPQCGALLSLPLPRSFCDPSRPCWVPTLECLSHLPRQIFPHVPLCFHYLLNCYYRNDWISIVYYYVSSPHKLHNVRNHKLFCYLFLVRCRVPNSLSINVCWIYESLCECSSLNFKNNSIKILNVFFF